MALKQRERILAWGAGSLLVIALRQRSLASLTEASSRPTIVVAISPCVTSACTSTM